VVDLGLLLKELVLRLLKEGMTKSEPMFPRAPPNESTEVFRSGIGSRLPVKQHTVDKG